MKLTVTFTGANLKSFEARVGKVLKIAKDDVEKDLADDFLRFFKRELALNRLGLVKLSPRTIAFKRQQKMVFPLSPMFGKGFNSTNSYINSISIRKLKNGTVVGIDGRKRHHSGITMVKFAVRHAEGYKTELGIVPSRDPLKEAYSRYKPKSRWFAMAKILKKRFEGFWKR